MSRVGLGNGDRAIFLGEIGPRGKHCTVLAVRGGFANVRFDQLGGMLTRASDLHGIPRRPKPDF